MKILLFCPTYERNGLDMLWPDTEASFAALQPPEGVIVDRVIGRDNPYTEGHRYRNTLHQFQNAQKMALEGGYDALCTFESDMIVPADGLIRLWNTPADVVYGLYLLRHGSHVVNAFRWIQGSPNIDQSLSLFPDLYQQGKKAGVCRVSGCGHGFTLIRRAVLERFPFRAWDETSFAPDWAMASDCQAASIEQLCRFDVVCGHIEDNGFILWPGKDGSMEFVRVNVIQTFTGICAGTTKIFRAGEVSEITRTEGIEYARAGFLEILADDGLNSTAQPRRRVSMETAVGKGGMR